MRVITVPDYATHDLYQAAYLVALRHQLRRLDGLGQRKTFIFEGTARADAERFHENSPIGALDFATALRQVKARLYGG
jgi:hypothetical protein